MKNNISNQNEYLNQSSDDFIYCWQQFSKRPNKLSLYSDYSAKEFIDYFSKNIIETTSIITEISPTGDSFVINEKSLIKLGDTIYMSFNNFDKLGENGFVGDVVFYYLNNDISRINDILKRLEEISLETESSRIFNVSIKQDGLDIEPIVLSGFDPETIDNYFNAEVFKKTNKLIKRLKNNSKGLTIVYGERGCGKTTLINYVATMAEKPVLFIPATMIETTINNPEFSSFVKKYKDSLIIIDDSELYFSEVYTKSNIFTNNLLQLVDGYRSDELGLNIIIILNVKDHTEIDNNLFECNNLIETIEVGYLDRETAMDLSRLVGSKVKIDSDCKLISVLKKRSSNNISEIGY